MMLPWTLVGVPIFLVSAAASASTAEVFRGPEHIELHFVPFDRAGLAVLPRTEDMVAASS